MKLLHVIALLPPLPLRAAGGFFVTSNYRTEPSQPWAATVALLVEHGQHESFCVLAAGAPDCQAVSKGSCGGR